MGHILSELSTMTRPSWVALHHMAHSFIELDKAVVLIPSLQCPRSQFTDVEIEVQAGKMIFPSHTASKG